jgi:hypothetical protein
MKRIAILPILFVIAILGATAQTDSTEFMKRLCKLQGISNVSKLESTQYSEKYVIKVKQNVDGTDDSKGTFDQRVIVGFRGYDRPTVIVTEGYSADYSLNPRYEEELCRLFNANLVFCEYRYFSESVPSPCNWDYMTVDNSLLDLHNVRQTLGELFTGKWISTGISKGGQTTMFYRATFPDDVDVSVSYVAPLNKNVEDGRHEPFLYKKVGTREERATILNAQREILKRKPQLIRQFEDYCNDKGYKYNASIGEIYDYCVLEYPFALWQWGTPVSTIPSADSSNDAWFAHFIKTSSPDYFSCPNQYLPFFVQAARELGYYGYSTKGLEDVCDLKNTKGYLNKLMLPKGLSNIKFDKSLYKRTVKFLEKNDPTHIFIYGEIDPWTASGVAGWLDCSNKENMRVYVQPRGSHTARISNMPENTKNEIISIITNWLKN